jgi:hypothetical protein
MARQKGKKTPKKTEKRLMLEEELQASARLTRGLELAEPGPRVDPQRPGAAHQRRTGRAEPQEQDRPQSPSGGAAGGPVGWHEESEDRPSSCRWAARAAMALDEIKRLVPCGRRARAALRQLYTVLSRDRTTSWWTPRSAGLPAPDRGPVLRPARSTAWRTGRTRPPPDHLTSRPYS